MQRRCDLHRKRGLQVGFDILESSCKRIVENRFKQARCRRSRAGADALLVVGCFENARRPDFHDEALVAPQPLDQK